MKESKRRVYFDHNATTYMREEVVEAMLPFLRTRFGNASSLHFFGQENRGVIDEAREAVASFIGAEPAEVVFTAGGTESDNIAIRGVVKALRAKVPQPHVITSSIEHPAVLRTCEDLEKEGVRVTWLPCRRDGTIDPAEVEKAFNRCIVEAVVDNRHPNAHGLSIYFPVTQDDRGPGRPGCRPRGRRGAG